MSTSDYCVALMYHALYANEDEWSNLLDEEKPYAVSIETFERHLQLLQQWGRTVLDPEQFRQSWSPGVLITFDDGHVSHFTHALPLLTRYGMKGIFFVTTDEINNNPRFCTWDQLKIMHEQGMSIHGHGQSHQFFADMSDDHAQQEFRTSFTEISVITPPWSMSFPGGRFTQRDVALALANGYEYVFSSQANVITTRNKDSATPLPRFAIKHTTDDQAFRAMVLPTHTGLFKANLLYHVKRLAKKFLGNNLYHTLYKMKAQRQD